jgi:prefoldin subunit 5
MAFYLELNLDEALNLINKKEIQLNQELDALTAESSKIKANIKLVINTIAQINQF